MLVDELVAYGIKHAGDLETADIRIGLGYTAVQLKNGGCGLAYTLHEEEYESCCVMPDAGRIAGCKAAELIPWMAKNDVTASAVGLATLNAVIPQPAGVSEMDILDLLPLQAGDTVGMIGYFGPLVEPIKKRTQALHIFERKSNIQYGILPESAAAELLPECQVVVISATTILNHSIDGLLQLAKNAREITVLGPSTPFIPDVLGRHGVTILSGVKVLDSSQALRIVSEGGGTRQFLRASRKLSLRIAS